MKREKGGESRGAQRRSRWRRVKLRWEKNGGAGINLHTTTRLEILPRSRTSLLLSPYSLSPNLHPHSSQPICNNQGVHGEALPSIEATASSRIADPVFDPTPKPPAKSSTKSAPKSGARQQWAVEPGQIRRPFLPALPKAPMTKGHPVTRHGPPSCPPWMCSSTPIEPPVQTASELP